MKLTLFSGLLSAAVCAGFVTGLPGAQPSADDEDRPVTSAIGVTHQADFWQVQGQRHQFELNASNLQLRVKTRVANWSMRPCQTGDMQVRHAGITHGLSLLDASRRQISRYENGFQTGVKVELGGYRAGTNELDLTIQLRLCLEGPEEELVATLLATDGMTRLLRCHWPLPVEPHSISNTVVPYMQGMLLPRDWPEKVWLYDTLCYGRGLYQPWWGHEQGISAMLVILETPNDGGCHFAHSAGGPTQIGPQWVSSLDRWAYPRTARLCFLDRGNYVDLAKRYRRYCVTTGRWVSLQEKIARNPLVGRVIGAPVVHTSILYHIQPESSYYQKDNPAHNHQWVSFAERADQLRALAAQGITNAYVHLDGWGFRGYDNLHPDVLPPCPEAGGWAGMRQFAEKCDQLGFLFAIHDQYRDFYLDAASYQERHTITDEQGHRPLHSTWYGGKQSVLCPSLAPGHVRKNHGALLAQGIKLRGAYLDVFSVVPPDECWQTEHPVTRTDCLQYRGECLNYVRSYGGIVSSEEPSEWSIPYLDLVHHGPYALNPNPGKGPAFGIPVPLFNLVFHDALFIPWSLDRGAWGIPEKDLGFLHALMNGGMPYLSLAPSDEELKRVRILCRLHQRLALTEMVSHSFLDASRRRQRTTFADGTRITVDLDKDQWDIRPTID
ncbi:MAG TPA: DUF5696 domain-containing protein [Candidatus Paceibacterota bacterium]|nr:DUF5696 domain-containing protein [Candidatus Paceibacterota bacterium]